MSYIIETERLNLRKIRESDYDVLCEIFQDIEVMYAWERAFSSEEVKQWVNKNLERYEKDGYSYFLALDKETDKVVGVMGPLIENINGENFIGIAYILNKKSWGMGYAIEGARACIDYAFNNLGADEVIAEIRPFNKSSIKVAKKLGMKEDRRFIKIYDNKEMEHIIYKIKNN